MSTEPKKDAADPNPKKPGDAPAHLETAAPTTKDKTESEPAKETVHDRIMAKKPASFIAACGCLSDELDTAVSNRDPEAIEQCHCELDDLGKKLKGDSTQEDKDHHHALAVKARHFAPRKLHQVEAIQANLEAELANKEKPVKAKVEHPAVTRAKEALAALQAEHAGHVELPEDNKAIEALKAKIAAAPLVEES